MSFNMQQMMKQAQKMQKEMAETQQKLHETEYEGQSGGGMVKITINGKGKIAQINIEKSLAVPDEVEVLEDLINGESNKVIAARMFISPRTIETHRANVLRKMSSESVASLAKQITGIRLASD